jgi:hypothetical protein
MELKYIRICIHHVYFEERRHEESVFCNQAYFNHSLITERFFVYDVKCQQLSMNTLQFGF